MLSVHQCHGLRGIRRRQNAGARRRTYIGDHRRSRPRPVRRISFALSRYAGRLIIGQRNFLAHGYNAVDERRLWDVGRNRLPALVSDLETMIAKLRQS
ncbi:MAG: DUF86 domain-containing protein [Enhydrobacter sp.]|nr:MAG: DUF86 domain-containing protein [Enhydrobacter sp.]